MCICCRSGSYDVTSLGNDLPAPTASASYRSTTERRIEPDARHLSEIPLCCGSGPAGARCGIERSSAGMAKAVTRVLALDCEVVGSVADGSAVLEAAQRLQPDVIVLDVNLPNVNGLEACRQI